MNLLFTKQYRTRSLSYSLTSNHFKQTQPVPQFQPSVLDLCTTGSPAEQTSSKQSADTYILPARAPDVEFVPASRFNIGFALTAGSSVTLD